MIVFLYRMVSKVTSMLKAYVPWVNKTLTAGLDTEKSINLPIKANFHFERPEELQRGEYGTWNVTMAVQSSYEQEVKV